MKYNFDEIIDRKTTYAEKWIDGHRRFGKEDVIPLWVADMDFRVAQPIIDAITERAQHGIFGYSAVPGSFIDAVCTFQAKRKGWNIDKSLISLAPGVVPSICMMINELTQKGDKIIIQTPVYHPFFSAVKDADRVLLESPLLEVDDNYYMDYDDIENKARYGAKCIVLCSPHNPVGRVWTKEELSKLGKICVKYGMIIISDEIHSDLILPGYSHTPIASISEEISKQTITCFSASKTFNIAGLQSSLVVFPDKETKHRIDKAWRKLHVEVTNCFSTVAVQAAFEHGEEWLEQVLTYIEGNMDFVINYINEKIPGIKVKKPQATYLMWLDCRGLGMNGEQLKEFMVHKAGLAMNTGHSFGITGEGFMRLNTGCPRSILEAAMKKLEEAVKEL